MVTLVTQAMELLEAAGADNPSDTLRPCSAQRSTTPSSRATPHSPGRSSAATWRRSAAHLAEIARTAPHTLPSYVALARDTLDRVVTDGRLLPIRAAKMRQVLAQASAPAPVVPEHHLR